MADDESDAAQARRRPGAAVYERLGSLTREARARIREPQRGWEPGVVLVPGEDVSGTTGRTVPDTLKEAASWSWRVLLVGALLYVVVRFLASVPIVTVPFVVALLLTAVLAPVQRWLRDRCRVPHSLAAFLALLVGIAVIGLIGSFVGTQISTNAPRMGQQIVWTADQLAHWLRTGPLGISEEQVAQYGAELRAVITRNQESLLTGALSTLSALSHAVGGALLLVLATFFLLRDGDIIWRWVLSMLPRRSRVRLDHMGRFGWRTLGGFMRGQTIIAFLHATTIFVVLMLLHVPMAVALSILIFVGSYIPILGMTVTGTLCVVASLIEDGPAAAIIVAVTIVVLIQLEAHLLQPLIMARTVEVHPLGVAMAVLAGTTVGGIAGALFAVPLVAFLNATVRAAHMMPADDTAPASPASADAYAGDDEEPASVAAGAREAAPPADEDAAEHL